MALYRDMDQAALDAAYDNGRAVAESAKFITDWERRSAEIALERPRHLDLRYGPRERNRIDYFAADAPDCPVLVFIHGGYWQSRAKELFRFIARGPLAHGIGVALVGYTLAPEARLSEIVDEVRTALSWLGAKLHTLSADASRIFVSGWSAGGHLTAAALDHHAVRGGLAISGLYDLEPIRLSYLNEKLRLESDEVVPLSPLHNIPGDSPPLIVTYGTRELPELQRQSEEYAAARAAAGLPGRVEPVEGCNHYTMLEELADPRGALMELVLELMRG
jgi:acetyl esterase/lipase